MRKISERRILADGITEKRCNRCGEWFPDTVTHFWKRNGKPTQPCRACERKRIDQWEDEHPDRVKRAKKEWASKNSDRTRLSKSLWVENNPQKNRDNKTKYSKAHPDRVRAAHHVYYSQHPEQSVVDKQRRRARVANLPDTFTASDWRRCSNYWRGCCAICGRPSGLWHTIVPDHWIPISDPRPDNPGSVPWNIIPLCHAKRDGGVGCNNSKWNYDPIEWLNKELGPRKAKKKLAEIEAYFKWLNNLTS